MTYTIKKLLTVNFFDEKDAIAVQIENLTNPEKQNIIKDTGKELYKATDELNQANYPYFFKVKDKNKLWPLGDDVDFIPGHGPVSTFKAERSSNPFVSDSVLG